MAFALKRVGWQAHAMLALPVIQLIDCQIDTARPQLPDRIEPRCTFVRRHIRKRGQCKPAAALRMLSRQQAERCTGSYFEECVL